MRFHLMFAHSIVIIIRKLSAFFNTHKFNFFRYYLFLSMCVPCNMIIISTKKKFNKVHMQFDYDTIKGQNSFCTSIDQITVLTYLI